jgi:hypothetical protein
MSADNPPWWTHFLLATIIAGIFAALPFWTRGLSVEMAKVAAMIIFPLVIAVYIFAVRRG